MTLPITGTNSPLDNSPKFSKPAALFWLLRLNRTVMVAIITGSGAYAAGSGVYNSLWMTLAGWCLAVGGFSIDFFADRDLDAEGPRAEIRHNPYTDNSLAPQVGLSFSIFFLISSFIITLLVTPWGLIPWGIILAIIIGLALHIFEHPISRALTLGLLQGLYVILGAISGQLNLAIWLLAGMFFFAMFGGRGMIDIRDFPQDKFTRVNTLPKRYGIRKTAYFTGICLFISYALSIAAYFTGEFSSVYLYLAVIFVVVGIICAVLFITRPSPELAFKLTLVFMMGMGSVICLAMILGSLI